jgi:acyl carrier protein
MTRAALILVIRSFLAEVLALPYMDRFSEEARLNEDLSLDSVMMLELLVSLELQHGLVLPEEAIMEKQLGTVGSFVEFLLLHGTCAPQPSDLLAVRGAP